jgi:5'(3')-deoxyribonucleotidase
MLKYRRVYIDMDGVCVDFEGYMESAGVHIDAIKDDHGHYYQMAPIKGAMEAIGKLIDHGYEVRIATKPPSGNWSAYGEKARWIMENEPRLSDHITITHDKGQLGNSKDLLIDDRPHKAKCHEFEGDVFKFDPLAADTHWLSLVNFLVHNQGDISIWDKKGI